MPETLQIRAARPGDGDAIARIRIAGWRHAYQSIVPADFLASMDTGAEAAKVEAAISDPTNPFEILLAVRGTETFGFIVFSRAFPGRDAQGGQAEVKALYVPPESQRTGTGSALLTKAINTLRPNYQSLIIWCLKDNPTGRAFYEKHGGQLIGEPKFFALPETPEITLVEVGYTWDLSEAPQY